jgi:DNA replication protein DnaD
MGRLIGMHPSQYSRIRNNLERRVNQAKNEKLVRLFGEGFDFLMEPVEVEEIEHMVRRMEKTVAA